jgi:hypothetical protein
MGQEAGHAIDSFRTGLAPDPCLPGKSKNGDTRVQHEGVVVSRSLAAHPILVGLLEDLTK